MNVIKRLPDVEAKKIAAGEVVERPASVVKELLENSLDAGAKKVSLHIEAAGKRLIRVVDDGCGMMPDDAKLCFANHATSKVISLADLEKIGTFGFRGEALASISSVSKVTLETRYSKGEHQEETGVRVEYVDGEVESEEAVASPLGTDLQIKDLFYNTPVRQKFLKQDETEWNQIQNLWYAFCLSHRDIHFVLYRDGRIVKNAPPVHKIKDRVVQLWGHNMGENMVELVQPEGGKGVGITGLISRHNYWRYGRQQIFFFVNGRWVKNGELGKGLLKGYKNVLPPARFPAAYLFFILDRSMVDINVHPRKEEVRFAKPVTVANLLQGCVTQTLEGLIAKQLAPATDASVSAGTPVPPRGDVLSVSETPVSTTPQHLVHDIVWQYATQAPPSVSPQVVEKAAQQEISSRVVEQPASAGKIIGQLLNTYIVVENDEGLLLIDQHAAHERILYEKYLKNFEHKDGTRLLFPEVIRLNDAQRTIVLQQQDFLKQQGIEVEQIGADEIAIKTSPPKIESQSLRELIFEMIEFIEQNEQLDQEEFRKKLNEHVHGQMACKMAIKAGDALSTSMMHNILTQLQEVDNRFICVHGRPTTWSMSKFKLEKTFRRR